MCREELHRIGFAEAAICGAATVLISVIIRGICGSPYRCINFLNLYGILPPVWLMSLLWLAWHFIIGAVMGAVMSSRDLNCEVSKYRGGMFWILVVVMGFIWYPMFFCAQLIFLALLDVLLVLCLTVICALDFIRVYRICGVLMFAYAIWLLWMFALNFRAILHA